MTLLQLDVVACFFDHFLTLDGVRLGPVVDFFELGVWEKDPECEFKTPIWETRQYSSPEF
jgi:hypothetical protein